MTPVSPSRPVSAAGRCPLRNKRIPCEDHTRRSVWPLPVESIKVRPAVAGSTVPSSRVSANFGSGGAAAFRTSFGRVVDFRVIAPFYVLRDHPALLQFLDALEIGEVAVRLLGVSLKPVQVVKLESRGRQRRIQLGSFFELSLRFVAPVQLLVQGAQLIMRDRLVRRSGEHALELLDGSLRVALMLIVDPEVEPSVRQRRILALHLLQKL